MATLEELHAVVAEIQERNRRVEIDKAWETSWTRKLFLMLFTYISIGFYMYAIGVKDSWLNAIVPTMGFLLSTLTLPFFKSVWEKYIKKK